MSKSIELRVSAKGMHCAKDLYDNAQQSDDLELERRALKACGYRVHEKERNGTRWLMAVKGLDVQYKHWHPLTSIHQAMQLLIDAPVVNFILTTLDDSVTCSDPLGEWFTVKPNSRNAKCLIAAQCRAIVTACASLEPVR